MGNQIEIEPTTFINTEGEEKFGVRVIDEGSARYIDTWDEIPADDMDIIRKVLDHSDDDIDMIMTMASDTQSSIYVGENFYKWSEVEDLFENVLS